MSKRYGAGELYGFNYSSLAPERIRELSAVSHREMDCPFKQVVPGKPNLKCHKKGGVCSLRQYESEAGKLVQASGPLVTTCPSRFFGKQRYCRMGRGNFTGCKDSNFYH